MARPAVGVVVAVILVAFFFAALAFTGTFLVAGFWTVALLVFGAAAWLVTRRFAPR